MFNWWFVLIKARLIRSISLTYKFRTIWLSRRKKKISHEQQFLEHVLNLASIINHRSRENPPDVVQKCFQRSNSSFPILHQFYYQDWQHYYTWQWNWPRCIGRPRSRALADQNIHQDWRWYSDIASVWQPDELLGTNSFFRNAAKKLYELWASYCQLVKLVRQTCAMSTLQQI